MGSDLKHVILHNLSLDVNCDKADGRAGMFQRVVAHDVDELIEAANHYGESWFKRDGAGAFFMLCRKWDRLEHHLRELGNYNIVQAIQLDRRAEGIIDDVRDLRRYLILVEAKCMELGGVPGEVAKGDKVAIGGGLHDTKRERDEALAINEEPTAAQLNPPDPYANLGTPEFSPRVPTKCDQLIAQLQHGLRDAERSGKHVPTVWDDCEHLTVELLLAIRLLRQRAPSSVTGGTGSPPSGL